MQSAQAQAAYDLLIVCQTADVVEPRYALGQLERLADLATELIRAQVDLIVAVGQAIDAARQATRIVPIVMLFSGLDPVAAKRVDSLARPGGNVTGIALLSSELTEKRLELLLQLTPKATTASSVGAAVANERRVRPASV